MQSEKRRSRALAALTVVVLATGSAAQADVPSPPVPRTYEPVWVRVLDDARVVRGVAAMEDGGFAMLIAGGDQQQPTLELRRFDASATPVWSVALREGTCADGEPEVREVAYAKGSGFTVLGAVSRATSVSYRDVHDVWITRIDESGKHVWQKLIGSPRGDEDGNGSLSVAEDGRVAVAYQQSAPESALERAASFVTELAKDGAHHWTARFTNVDTDHSALRYAADGRLVFVSALRSERHTKTLEVRVLGKEGAVASSQRVACDTWYSPSIASVVPGSIAVRLHSGEVDQVVSWKSDQPPVIEKTTLPGRFASRIETANGVLYLLGPSHGSEPRELAEVDGKGAIVRHPLAFPSQVTSAACPAPGKCMRDIHVSVEGVLAQGEILAHISVEARNAPAARGLDYRAYHFLVAYRPAAAGAHAQHDP